MNRENDETGHFLIYEAEDREIKIDVRIENETVWLTQQLIAELFQSSKQNISYHINSIYEEGELQPEATVKKYLTVRQEGNREVKRVLEYYNLYHLPIVNARFFNSYGPGNCPGNTHEA